MNTMVMAWLLLAAACAFEVGYSGTMRWTQGFTKVVPSIVNILFLAGSLYFMECAVLYLPVSTTYSIWTSMGTVGTVLIGVFYYHEKMTPLRLLFVFGILVSVIGLNITG